MLRLTLLYALLLGTTLGLSAQGSCKLNDCQNGKGRMVFPDGGVYEGDFENGLFHGLGRFTYPNQAYYVGNWRRGEQQGGGRLTEPDGTTFHGSWHRGQKHGPGTVVFPDQNKLKGTWLNDERKGDAEFLFANGDYYKGDVRGATLHGRGTLHYANGDVYTGDFLNNQRNGRGTLTFEDGNELAGKWEADNYQADWINLGYTGDRNQLADCNQGCNGGEGKYRYPNGTVYYGKIQNGQPAGSGTLVFPNGNLYHGATAHHQPSGLGIMHYADGEMHGGVWRDGSLQKKVFQAMGRPARNLTPDFDPEIRVWAVIVGAARYTTLRTLKYTDDDAYQLYAFLRSVEGGALPANQIKVLIDEDATHRNIVMTMRETFRQADENDVILFYFSGHGEQDAFLPVDYDGMLNRLEHYQVKDALLASRAKHKLVIADACHSGSFVGRQDLAARTTGGGVNGALTAYYQALENASASTALLLSSKGEEISLEDRGLRSGIFSHYLIRGLSGEADANEDALVSIQELFNYVHREVRAYTGNIQTPVLTGAYDELMPVSVIRGKRR